MLISVKIRTNNQTLKPFGIVNAPPDTSLSHFYEEVCRCNYNSGDNFILPQKYRDWPVACSVSKDVDMLAMPIPLTASITESSHFGKYLTFTIEEDVKSALSQVPDAFKLMMDRARTGKDKIYPAMKDMTRPNARYSLHNAILRWLQEVGVGWTQSTTSMGER